MSETGCLVYSKSPLKISAEILTFLKNYLSKMASMDRKEINRKFRVTTEIVSTFFGCCSVTGQLKIKI
jgi:hypothetical protein